MANHCVPSVCARSAQSSAKSSSRISSFTILVQAKEMEDASIGLEPDVMPLVSSYLATQYHAKEDGKKFGGQHAASFHTISDGEGVQKVATMFDLTFLAFVELASSRGHLS